jgi:tripartite-type tricarboxylate transporter receptor subunit TctC
MMANKPWKRRAQTTVASILLVLAMSAAHAQQPYPTKPIRMIVPAAPGGPTDLVGRAVAQGLGEAVGQQIVIDNRAGAAGLIGSELVAKAPPDGYTLLFSFSGPLAIVPNLNDATPYNPLTDFAPISMVGAADYILLAHPSVPAKTVKELVALAKARPGKMHFASGGTGTGIHMAGELFKHLAGVQIVHVPYKGAAPGMVALMAGEVDMMFNAIPPTFPQINAGKVRALAVGGAKRSALLPKVPTIRESGYDFEMAGWYGVLAPKGTPQAVVSKLHGDLIKALRTPEMKERFRKLEVYEIGTTPEEFLKHIRAENARWAKVIQAAGLKKLK